MCFLLNVMFLCSPAVCIGRSIILICARVCPANALNFGEEKQWNNQELDSRFRTLGGEYIKMRLFMQPWCVFQGIFSIGMSLSILTDNPLFYNKDLKSMSNIIIFIELIILVQFIAWVFYLCRIVFGFHFSNHF